ncbi:hypothetical protein B0H13DRAFT_1863647 [Mycena leptocephala]|nr:hypothetical protein B0H13DRAFT_1863647 [Mycena leptocephala]
MGTIPAPISGRCVRPVRGPVCASMGRHGSDSPSALPSWVDTLNIVSSGIFIGVPIHVLVIKLFDFNSSSRRAQETASPESGHTPRNAEGRSICIKAEKIVGDRGPKGMRDSKPAGQPSSDVDPRSHVDIGEPRPEVWTYFRGEPEQLQQLDQGAVVRLGGAQGEELQYDVRMCNRLVQFIARSQKFLPFCGLMQLLNSTDQLWDLHTCRDWVDLLPGRLVTAILSASTLLWAKVADDRTQKMYNEHTDSLSRVQIGHPMHYIQRAEHFSIFNFPVLYLLPTADPKPSHT